MRQLAQTPREKETLRLIEEAKALRTRELARLSGRVLRLPQTLLHRLSRRGSVTDGVQQPSTQAM